ncbi:MAG: ATP-binding protein [Bacteroidota bacterium]|jgi:PAS domain S-box-containing protein
MIVKNEIYHLIFEVYPGLVLVHDQMGIIKDMNRKASDIIFEKIDFHASTHLSSLLSRDQVNIDEYLSHLTTYQTFKGRYKHVRRNGETMVYKFLTKPLPPEFGNNLFVIFATDITRLTNAEKELDLANRMGDLNLKRLHRALTDLEKAKALTENSIRDREHFLARMSHEIRTPLNGIIGFSEVLLKYMPEIAEKKYAELIHKTSLHLNNLINDILDLSKLDSGHFTIEKIPFCLREISTDLQSMFLMNANEKGISLEFNGDSFSDMPLLGDAGRILQVLLNLLGNALKFTEKGFVRLNMDICSITDDDARIKFEVKDTGIGIPKELLPDIFEGYRQAHADDYRKYGGTGLGLSICKQLLQLMGSDLHVESKEGEGTCFYFEVTTERYFGEINKPLAFNSIGANALQGFKVLIAEDNEINLLLAEKILTDAGAAVTTCTNGKDAVNLAKAYPFDFILLDIQMPIMSGLEACQQIRKFNNIPVIATSAYVSENDKKNFRAAGIDYYLSKPINPEGMVRLFQDISRKKKKENGLLEQPSQLSQNLHRISGGDEGYTKGIMKLIRSKIPEMLIEVEDKLNARNWVEFKKACHKLLPNITLMDIPSVLWLQKIEEQKIAPESWDEFDMKFYILKEECMEIIWKI